MTSMMMRCLMVKIIASEETADRVDLLLPRRILAAYTG
jgi:hypothetical protein